MINETRSGASHPAGAINRGPTKDTVNLDVGRPGHSNAPQGEEKA